MPAPPRRVDAPDRSVEQPPRNRHLVPFRDAVRYWTKLGFINFGGPAGQIAIMHEELVDRRRWISNGRFLHALNFCMLLPGPEAQQLAIYIGWLLNGVGGAIAAGVLFVLPAFFLIMALSWTYAVHGDIAWVAAVFYGLEAAVIALVGAAVLRLGSKALKHPVLIGVAVASFVAIFFLRVPFPLIVIGAAALGIVGSRIAPGAFEPPDHGASDEGSVIGDSVEKDVPGDPYRRMLKVAAVGLIVWWVPLLSVIVLRGREDTLSEMALFFSQAAMVTFGGAYAVLSYINQAAIHTYGWLEPGQMITGLGLAESTPGPLIMVTQFVGFLGAYGAPGGLDRLSAGIAGATVATWATFAPCFLWILVGAPHIERLRGNRLLQGALSSVTAAVVGVVLNLAVTFALVALFARVTSERVLGMTVPRPDPATLDLFALGLAVVGFIALWRYKVNVLWVVAGSALAGLVYGALT